MRNAPDDHPSSVVVGVWLQERVSAMAGSGCAQAVWDDDRGVLEILERLPPTVNRVWLGTDGAGDRDAPIRLANAPLPVTDIRPLRCDRLCLQRDAPTDPDGGRQPS